jgi:glycosyltransferase involved in cell wall biosynthesis
MRVLHVIPSLSLGGGTKLVLQIAEGLAKSGHTIHLVVMGPCDKRPKRLPFDCTYLGYGGLFRDIVGYAKAARKLNCLMARFQPTIVHAHLWPAVRLAVPIARFRRVPTVVHIHDTQPWMQDGNPKSRLLQAATRLSISGADVHFLSVSHQVLRYHRDVLDLPSHRSHVVFNGVDLPKSTGLRTLSPHKLVLGYAGRLAPEKNPQVLVALLERLLNAGIDTEVRIAGDGVLLGTLQSLAREKKLANRIHFLGWQASLTDFFKSIHALLVPSAHEGMPLVILEAMANGVPVIASPVGGVAEVIFHEENGFLAHPQDLAAWIEITKALRLEALQNKIGNSARQTIEARHSLKQVVSSVAGLYRSVV